MIRQETPEIVGSFLEELLSLEAPLWKAITDTVFSSKIDAELSALARLTYVTSLEGTPYQFGGKSEEGVDCSGLVQMVYPDYFGTLGPNGEGALHANQQYQKLLADGKGSIAVKDLQTGDLVYFSVPGSDVATHTAIVKDVKSGPDGTKVLIIAASPGAHQVKEQTLRADGSLDSHLVYLGGGQPGGR